MPDTGHGPRKVTRDPEHRIVGGVCSGIARALQIDVLLVRIVFIALAFAGGLGVVAYLLCFALMPRGEGRPLAGRLRSGRGAVRVALGIACLTLATLLVARELGIWWHDAVVWPIVIALAGTGLIWRQQTAPRPDAADRPSRPRPASTASPAGADAPADGSARAVRRERSQRGVGTMLVLGAALLFLWANGVLSAFRDVVLTIVVIVGALALILAPLWQRQMRRLRSEREARIRSQERAEVAAHLHDSVLQTLALIQRRADDPQAIATLARRQERDLRAWLNGAPEQRPDERVGDALRAVAAEIEERHTVPIDVVLVGPDRALDERARALVAAAREALTNAVRHGAGGGEPIALYAESGPDRIEVFIRDRGPGFALDAVAEDRRGVRESIIGRMERAGGSATIHSSPDSGTEVELILEDRHD